MSRLADPAHHATALALGLLAAALLLCWTTWLAVGAVDDPALQLRHLALGGFGALACAATGALLLTTQVERATDADEGAAWAQITTTPTPTDHPHGDDPR